LSHFPPQERRRAYKALGLKVLANADSSIEVRGNFEEDFFPPEKQIQELVEGILYAPKQQERREEFPAAIAERTGEHRRDVMSIESTPTCSACST
jgi:hypothetical protein